MSRCEYTAVCADTDDMSPPHQRIWKSRENFKSAARRRKLFSFRSARRWRCVVPCALPWRWPWWQERLLRNMFLWILTTARWSSSASPLGPATSVRWRAVVPWCSPRETHPSRPPLPQASSVRRRGRTTQTLPTMTRTVRPTRRSRTAGKCGAAGPANTAASVRTAWRRLSAARWRSPCVEVSGSDYRGPPPRAPSGAPIAMGGSPHQTYPVCRHPSHTEREGSGRERRLRG